ncbi:MAG: phosphoadenosine phosphosulfate reductase family protein [Desulfurococcales archaeon]|nr:phosphoadenosine phosphosulfate reductase family protein [Desulfurococcales archaeon]
MRLRLLVRARKDAKAVEAALRLFYRDFDYTVEHLGGLRGEALASEAAARARPFTVILLPEREASLLDPGVLPPYSTLVPVGARDVRNLRLEQIASLIARGRAALRLSASWLWSLGAYRLDGCTPPTGLEADPSMDVTILYSKGLEALSGLLGLELRGHALAYLGGGTARIHYAGSLIGEVGLSECPPRAAALQAPPGAVPGGLEALLEANRGALEAALRAMADWLAVEAGGARLVAVPWSGGKDSTAALVLAVEALGPERVVAVHVDTGLEFPETEEYVEEVASRLGVELVRVHAGLDAEARRRGLPVRGDRWCTGLKLAALSRALRGIAASRGPPVVVVGDRDAESASRSRRPPVRLDPYHGLRTLAPLKLLSAAHTLLIPLLRGVEPNPLYAEGFYRIGCFTCPYMSCWERLLMERGLASRVAGARPDALGLLERFLSRGPL